MAAALFSSSIANRPSNGSALGEQLLVVEHVVGQRMVGAVVDHDDVPDRVQLSAAAAQNTGSSERSTNTTSSSAWLAM